MEIKEKNSIWLWGEEKLHKGKKKERKFDSGLEAIIFLLWSFEKNIYSNGQFFRVNTHRVNSSYSWKSWSIKSPWTLNKQIMNHIPCGPRACPPQKRSKSHMQDGAISKPERSSILFIWDFDFFFLSFLGPHPWHMEVLRWDIIGAVAAGLYRSHSNTGSATYTTAHGNARSLTH